MIDTEVFSGFRYPVKITKKFIFVHEKDEPKLLMLINLFVNYHTDKMFLWGLQIEFYNHEKELEWLTILR